VEIEIEGAVGLSQQEEEAGRVDTNLVHDLAQRDELTGALPHADRLPGADQIHELDEQDAQQRGVEAEPGDHRAHARGVAVMIRASSRRAAKSRQRAIASASDAVASSSPCSAASARATSTRYSPG